MESNQEIIQIVISQLKASTSRERFIELTKEMKNWFSTQEGFISYEVYENNLNWANKIVYKNNESAKRINHLFMETETAKEILKLVEPNYNGFMGTNVEV